MKPPGRTSDNRNEGDNIRGVLIMVSAIFSRFMFIINRESEN
jgi:hypothetical protein